MKITNEIPRDWKDLQNKVCKFLNEAGYESESPKTIKTVRGDVEVDVFSVSNDELIKQFICECKFWNMPVSKEYMLFVQLYMIQEVWWVFLYQKMVINLVLMKQHIVQMFY